MTGRVSGEVIVDVISYFKGTDSWLSLSAGFASRIGFRIFEKSVLDMADIFSCHYL